MDSYPIYTPSALLRVAHEEEVGLEERVPGHIPCWCLGPAQVEGPGGALATQGATAIGPCRAGCPQGCLRETGYWQAGLLAQGSPILISPLTGTSVMQVMASDADDPTYGSSARVVYSVLEGEQHFTVDSKTGKWGGGTTAMPGGDGEQGHGQEEGLSHLPIWGEKLLGPLRWATFGPCLEASWLVRPGSRLHGGWKPLGSSECVAGQGLQLLPGGGVLFHFHSDPVPTPFPPQGEPAASLVADGGRGRFWPSP